MLRQYLTFTREDLWVLLVIVYPYIFAVNFLLLDSAYFHFPLFLQATLVSVITGTCFWALHIIFANVVRYSMTGYSQSSKRLLIQFPGYVILSAILGVTIFCSFRAFHFIDTPLSWHSFRPVFIAGIILNIAATSFHEGLYAFKKWKATTLEKEQLEKSYFQSQYEGLKSQVNPHFLFNSLNSLSALINSNQEKASTFVDEMSKVYRYLLKSNESELIPLEAELQFVHSFFHMLKTRHDEAIELNIHIPGQHDAYLIPPLTLQLLIENAVKHNVISMESPLKIDISASPEDNTLTVRNNIQKKMTPVLSNGVGLRNIITKYQLLNNSAVEIMNDGHFFIVKLPLFLKPHHEHTDR